MCVIIHQPEGTNLSKERAERLWKRNPDGGGFIFIDDDNTIRGWKSMNFQDLWGKFEASRSQFTKRDFILHFRIKTHGDVDINNVHPFRVKEGLWMAHNGMIHGAPEDPEGKKSDTRMFIEEVLPRLPEGWLDDPYLVSMVEEWIGWSRLAFLSTDPKLEQQVYLLNEDSGTWRDGMWFSNDHAVDPPQPTPIYRYRPNHAKTGNKGKSPATLASEDVPMAALWGWDDDEYFMPNRASNPFRVVKKEEKKENEVLVLQDLLKEVREADGLSMRIQWNSHDKEYECWGCDETVDKNSGECDCWNKVCMDCQNIAGMCACPQGWSSNLKFWTDVDEEVQEGALKRL